MIHRNKQTVLFESNLIAGGDIANKIMLENHWIVECYDENGDFKWRDEFDNLVVTSGLNDSLDKHLKGSGYTAAWYLGLTDGTPTFAAGDTITGSHAGWVEVQDYSQATRPQITFGAVAAGSVSNSASPSAFSITGTTTVGGAFMVSQNTKGGATGILYGGAAFAEGDRAVVSGDTLNVTVTCTAAAA